MTGLIPRDTREWMRTVERGILQARGAAASAVTVAQDRIDDAITVVNNDRNRIPAPPIELTSQTYIALGANKRFAAGVIVDFPDVTIGNDALPMSIEQYELWGRTGTENFVRLTTNIESALQWFGADPGSVWDFKVRAIGALAVKPGVFSSVITVTMLNDTTAPGQPSTPAISTQGKTITIKWDGKVAGGASMPLDLDYVTVAAGNSASPTTEVHRMPPGPSLFVDTGMAYNTPRYYRLQAVDTSGNKSAWSVQVSAVAAPLVDDDIIMAQIDAAETEIINIGAASILNGAINSAKLAENAVAQVHLQDQIISLGKLDTNANNKIQKGVDDAFAAQATANTAAGNAVTALANASAADGKAGTAQAAADKAQAVVDAKIAAGSNLAVNGSFDSMPITSPPLGWPTRTLAVVQASATTARSGTNVIKCSPTTATNSSAFTDWGASATGRTYYVEYWIRADQAIIAANNGLELGMYVSALTAAGTTVNTPVLGSSAAGSLYPKVYLSDLSTTAWTKFAQIFTIPTADTVQARGGFRVPALATAGNTFEIDGFRYIDITEAKGALDAAAVAQARADEAFDDAFDAYELAGLAQSAANGKNNIYYAAAKPAGSGFADGDTVFIRTAPGAPITEQWKWIKTGPATGSWNQETLGHQIIASVDLGKATVGELNGIYVKAFSLRADALKVGSTANMHPDPKVIDTAGWTSGAFSFGAIGTGKNGQGSILVAASASQVGSYYGQNDVERRVPVRANSSYRISAWVKAAVTIPVGGVAIYARLYPVDGSAFSFTTPGNISNNATIPANTWTEVTGVVTTGALDAGLVLGMFKQAAMTAETRFSDPAVEMMGVGRLIVDGTIQGNHVQANSIAAKHMTITDLTNFAPSLAESPTDWTLQAQMEIVTSGLDTSGYRFQVTDGVAESRAYGPFMAVKPGENLWMGANLYRGSGTVASYLRYFFYDKDKNFLAGGAGTQYVGAPQSSASNGGVRFEGPALVPANAAYARWTVIIASGTGSTGFYNIVGRRRLAGELIIDGTVTSDKVATNAITAKNIVVGDFANLAIGSDFEDAAAVPWTLAATHTITTAQKKSGTSSLRLAAATGSIESVFTNDMRVKEGEQWYFKYHAYIDAAFNGSAGNSKLRIGDQNGSFLADRAYTGITRSVWTTVPLEITFTVPAGVTSLKVSLVSDHTAGTAYIDDIQIRRMSEASLIQNLGVEKLTASAANIDTAVIDKLWTDVVRSRLMTTDMMVVGRGVNPIPDTYFDQADIKTARHTLAGAWGAWGVSGANGLNTYGGNLTAGTSRSFYFDATTVYDKNSYIPVEPDQKWRLSVLYTSGTSGPRATVRFIKRDGTTGYTSVGWLKKDDTSNVYDPSGTLRTLERVYTVPSDVAYIIPAVQFEATCTSATVYGGATFTNMASSALIVEGAIATRHLTVTEDMTVKLLAAHKVEATEIDTNDLAADVGFIGDMTAVILTVDSVKATQIDATGGITSKHTITGATIQTLTTANRGIKISGGNLKAYNSTGGETFSVTGSTGVVEGTGKWKTGSSGNYAELMADGSGGLLRFWTGSGTGRGSIYARDDAGGKRMTLSFSDLDVPTGVVPLLAVHDSKISMDYGSKHIKVGSNGAGGEILELDATGSDVMIKGGLELADSGARVRWRYSSSNFALGYIGQRPETNTGIADFEVRAAANGVRLSGTELIANPIYSNTSSSAANVFVDSNGKVWRSTSASRYKADQRLLTVPDSLLEIRLKDWVDKNQAALFEEMDPMPRPFTETDQSRFDAINMTREPGVIAEDVEAHGGAQFTIYGPDGQTEGVKYERLALAQIQVLYRRLLEAEQRITELQGA